MQDPAPSLPPTYKIFVKAPCDAAKGGDVEKTAKRLIAQLGQGGEFAFSGLTPHKKGLAGYVAELASLRHEVSIAGCVWLHDCCHLISVLTYLWARRERKPIIITQHADVSFRTNFIQNAFFQLLDRFVTRPMLRLADQVIFSSDAVAESYYRLVAFTKPIQIIPNGVDLDTFQPASPERRQELRGRFALRDDQPVVIFAGKFTRHHDMPVIHNLAQLLPDWRFWLIGNGTFNPEKWFLPNVQAFRNRNRDARASLYQAADLMIAPNATTRFPTGFQEALACGVPVLCSPVTAEGSHFAKAHIETEDVDPRAPEETALLWADTLRAKRDELPRTACKPELANIAQLFWDEAKISSYYAEIIRTISLPAERGTIYKNPSS